MRISANAMSTRNSEPEINPFLPENPKSEISPFLPEIRNPKLTRSNPQSEAYFSLAVLPLLTKSKETELMQ